MDGCAAAVKSDMRLILLGPPGSGKGTQAELLSQRHATVSLASGDILREAMRRGDPLGQQASRYMSAGALVPDDLVTGVILRRLEGVSKDQPFVLDGFPRTQAQARALDAKLAESDQAPIDRVVDFEIDEEKVVRRLAGRRICGSCGASYHMENKPPRAPGRCDRCGGALALREDDQPETIRRRLRVYHEQTEPLLAFYRQQGKLRSVPGDLGIEHQYRALEDLLRRERLV